MRPDFSLIWGSDNAPFTPIEASDYTAGWVFRTGAPPRRVNFDYFQNLSDQRTAWLGEQMLNAVGHDYQSDVSYDDKAYVRGLTDGNLYASLITPNLGNTPESSPAAWKLVVIGAGVGVDQTWQDLTASRAFNTTYTNTTGKTISVFVYQGGKIALELQVSGVTVGASLSNSENSNQSVNALVPAGDTYRVISFGGSLLAWSELRS